MLFRSPHTQNSTRGCHVMTWMSWLLPPSGADAIDPGRTDRERSRRFHCRLMLRAVCPHAHTQTHSGIHTHTRPRVGIHTHRHVHTRRHTRRHTHSVPAVSLPLCIQLNRSLRACRDGGKRGRRGNKVSVSLPPFISIVLSKSIVSWHSPRVSGRCSPGCPCTQSEKEDGGTSKPRVLTMWPRGRCHALPTEDRVRTQRKGDQMRALCTSP